MVNGAYVIKKTKQTKLNRTQINRLRIGFLSSSISTSFYYILTAEDTNPARIVSYHIISYHIVKSSLFVAKMMLRFSLTSLALWSTVFPFAQVAAFSPGMKGHQECALHMASTASTEEILTVTPIKSLDGTVTLPGSKSLSNRCLLLAALSEGNTRVDNLLESDDIRYMLEALDTLQVPVEKHSSESVTVTGQAGPINSPKPADETVDLFLGNAGTAMRPLAAALCMGQGKFVLDGVPRMRERPIADLIDGLRQLGADVTCVDETGCPPVTINAEGLKGGEVRCVLCCVVL